MSEVSQKQLEANRENTKLGGVKTEEGKVVIKDDRNVKIERAIKPFIESFTFFDSEIMKEYADLREKGELTPKEEKKKTDLALEIAMIHGLKNGVWAGNLSYQKYFKSLTTMRSSLVKEYDCKTPIELMLVDRIVANYWQAMRSDTLLNHYIENEDGSFSINQLKINTIREFNRGLERADRQLNASIILLKGLKQPKLNIRVNTENAYIAQNQQVVTTDNIADPTSKENY